MENIQHLPFHSSHFQLRRPSEPSLSSDPTTTPFSSDRSISSTSSPFLANVFLPSIRKLKLRVGGTKRLPRLIGSSIAKELIFTGRKITPKEALSFGLINYCAPTGDAYSKALEIACYINQKGPVAIRMAKRVISHGLEMEIGSGLLERKPLYKGE
ncbi:unnamed protein product [Lactuca saligna]|uniref:Uncharacterized protein n=1 Tax=Lactuca saligna TaxID=75948 RepID=A0AA36A5S6_LACSI|nr:unnamed protein product [Lactuca saligna]